MTIEHIRGIVGNVERLPSSRMGNPRYRLAIGDTTVRTAPDSGLGYSVRNLEGKAVVASVRMLYGHLTMTRISLE